MSPPGRYQSNLFNFLSRQSMTLRDRSTQTWRQMKLAAVWGVQILLYPIYVGFQATRLVGKQLRQTARQVLPKLKAVAQTIQPVQKSEILLSDTPIQRSLQLLDRLTLSLPIDRLAMQLDPQDPSAPGVLVVVGGSAIVGAGSSQVQPALPEQVSLQIVGSSQPALPGTTQLSESTSQSLARSIKPIHGLASLLTSRNLVLVTTENQVLDVLSLEQQAILQRRIVGEVANYWRQQRSLTAQTNQLRPFVDNFLPLPAERTRALPPIRAFWQLMSWMQTSTVAIAANLFQEAYLLPAAPSAEMQLPEAIAALRSAQPTWRTGDELLNQVGNWLRNSSRGVTEFLRPDFVQPDAPPPLPSQHLGLTLEDGVLPQPPHGFMAQIRSKLREAQQSKLVRSATKPEQVQADSPLAETTTFQDLTQAEIAKRAQASQSQRSLGLRRSGQLSRSSQSSSQLVPDAIASITSIELPEIALVSRSAEGALTQSAMDSAAEAQGSELIPNSSWIDAEVSLVTYEKHPLEQLLDWLDRGMAWIEISVSQAWQWLRDRLS